ncbi:Ig-like domain-containing protein [Fructobacillus sp. M158]|uniref:collagen binding domain-containing protein n=1 Tax=Fructobacillus parabroussonetiae TaxID=2713174 RepID=UPI00200A5722|nr:collagen binding domain-containing protein [Fructobacillus parabroussonetiae]MCK8617726.1 Ig-like domain-containing protein [Fructobacillus parabroussonetiae]
MSDVSDPGANPMGFYDKVLATWNFAVPNNAELSAGDTLTLPIPAQLDALTDDDFNIKSTAGNIFAAVHVDKSAKTIAVTFNDYTAQAIKTHTLTGSLKLPLIFNAGAITPDKNNVIPWGIGDLTTTVPVGPIAGPAKQEQIFKWSWFDPNDKNLIHWRIRLNANAQLAIQNGVITDKVLSGHQIVSPITANYATFTDGQNYTVGAAIASDQIHQTSGQDFTVNIGDTHGAVVVAYDTRITDDRESPSYGNTAKYSASNLPGDSVTVWQGLTNGSGSANSGNKPTPDPSPAPSPSPAPTPNPTPSPSPSPAPSPNPSPKPTPAPSPAPKPEPAPEPTPAPTPNPTPVPVPNKGKQPSDEKGKQPNGSAGNGSANSQADTTPLIPSNVGDKYRIGKTLPATAQVISQKGSLLLLTATVLTAGFVWYSTKYK